MLISLALPDGQGEGAALRRKKDGGLDKPRAWRLWGAFGASPFALAVTDFLMVR